MTSPSKTENLIILKSPEVLNVPPEASANQSPRNNPFDVLLTDVDSTNSPFKIPYSPRKVIKSPFQKKRSPLTLLDNNNSFDLGRESLGILPNNVFESVANDLFNTNLPDNSEMMNLSLGFMNVGGRESLGILNTSILNDLGRESIGIFDVKNSFQRRIMDDNGENYAGVPEISISVAGDQTNSNSATESLNKGFLFSHSKALSTGSQTSNPSFHYQSFEEPSQILMASNFFQKTHNFSASNLATTDPFNEALQGTEAFIDKQFTASSFTASATKGVFSSNLGFVRNRIHSLPVTYEEKTGVGFDNCFSNLEAQNQYTDSVFEEAKKLIDNIAEDIDPNDSKNMSSSNENNFLDATPQPDWPEDLSLNNSVYEEKAVFDKETVSKQVNKLFEKLPDVTEKIRIRSQTNSRSISSENSTNLSRISKTSCGTQNVSRISRNSDDNVSAMLANLSQFIQKHEDLSNSMKQEGENAVNVIQNLLHVANRSNESKNSNNEVDSGHSSVDDQQLEERQKASENRAADSPSPNFVCKSDLAVSKSSVPKLLSRSSNSPTTSKIAVLKTPNSSVTSNNSQNSNDKKRSNATSVRYPLAAGSQRKSGILFPGNRTGPLKAVIPVEYMTKNVTVDKGQTPPKRVSGGLMSKKTSTPIQEPKLKPMAASTPAVNGRSAGENEQSASVSPLNKPKYTSSSSDQKSTANKPLAKYSTSLVRRNSSLDCKATKTTTNINKVKSTVGEKPATSIVRRNSVSDTQSARKALNKPSEKFEKGLVRRNSVTETNKRDGAGSDPRSKRSFSIGGKDTKIMSALNKVRQNILDSPYYSVKTLNPSSSQEKLTSSNKVGDRKSINSSKKLGKENIEP